MDSLMTPTFRLASMLALALIAFIAIAVLHVQHVSMLISIAALPAALFFFAQSARLRSLPYLLLALSAMALVFSMAWQWSLAVAVLLNMMAVLVSRSNRAAFWR